MKQLVNLEVKDINFRLDTKELDQNNQTDIEKDIRSIEKRWNIEDLVTDKTVFIIVGTHLFCELTDRISCIHLQKEIDSLGDCSI